jgi:hypothetical protein
MEQISQKEFTNTAMKYGTYLGIVWALMYVMLFNSLSMPILSFGAWGIIICAPILSGYMATRFRKAKCEDTMSYSQAWKFLAIMHLCAALFSAMINYLYLHFIDKGHFLGSINATLSEITETAATPDVKEQMNSMFEMFSNYSAMDLTWAFLNNNIFVYLILTSIIALIVKKNNYNRL